MIVIVIAGILFFVALPAYQNSVLKSNRAAGRGVLLDVASRQEQYFINNKQYADALPDLGYPATYYVINLSDYAHDR
jgi:type IV pilus assembly protein PilE